jgi:hypothetical protein
MRYRLRTLLIVASVLALALGVLAIPIAWLYLASHPTASLPWLHVYSSCACVGGTLGIMAAGLLPDSD